MKKYVLMAVAFGMTLLLVPKGYSSSLNERYPAPWRDEFNMEITRALASSKIRGCGEYKYRESSRNKGEYLVYCTRDGSTWFAYIVWIYSKKVMGPYKPDASLD